MVQSQELLTALVFVGVSLALFIGLAGVRRIPWRHAATMGAGFGTVFAALWSAQSGADLPILVLVGALGGTLVQRGFERGERERSELSREITSRTSAPPA